MIRNDLTPKEREKKDKAERDFIAQQNELVRQHNIELAQVQAETKPDPWPTVKSVAYAPCYLFAIIVVGTLALFNRTIPQVLIDFLNS